MFFRLTVSNFSSCLVL